MPYELVRLLNSDHPYRYDGTIFGGTKLWTPSQITTALWLDADKPSSITLNGATVSQWNDLSGNGRHATQATAANQPAWGARKVNGLFVMDFVSDFFTIPLNISRSVNPALSVFCVFAQDANTGSMALFGNDDGAFDRFVLLNFDVAPGYQWGVSNGGGTEPLTPSQSPDIYNHVLSLQFNYQAHNGSYVCLDGNTRRLFTDAGGDGTTSFGLGAIDNSGTYVFDGYIAEFVVTPSLTDLATQQKMEGYLAWKWGTQASLPVSHPYYSAPPLA